jgi:hypothetical protein
MRAPRLPPRALPVGESAEFWVHAEIQWNDSGVDLIANGKYDLVVLGSQTWNDASIVSGAGGYGSHSGQHIWERFRRIPTADWLELIGTIGKSTDSAFIMGKKLIGFSPSISGRLYCFANDLRFMYWNNSGSIKAIVSRID